MSGKAGTNMGERNAQARLTPAQVVEARRRYRRYSHTDGAGALALEYGVSRNHMWRVVTRRRWRRLT